MLGPSGALPAPFWLPRGAPGRLRSHFRGPERVVFESKSGFDRVQSASKSIPTTSIMFSKDTITMNMNMKNKDEGKPLHWAVYFQLEEMVSFLLSSGANVNSLDGNGLTPLDTASGVKLTVMQSPEKLKINERISQILIDNGGQSASDL